ncbi:DNA-binding NarL/FixJ family response regulator [Nocardioides aromaticivorans]|uniref:DNA-binding NarL/FixJ family response regulator n=1 Tax=Nocardioides aromaticivorans TaxID=200618 RepID=A0A7Y9ZJ00_9ACTN|nr:LuxR C-terminal-related transcriptional regulator [Nocardioides aromaticivorans]NYI45218.1 DNA-binding NarL/FixJ family response regulator [Nocardioides aromaticivorans]QSR24330.1 hypothetical protein CFH99_01660 [Nocardioides aromaticivorans]
MLELTYVAATSRLDRLGIQERQVLQLIAHGQSDAAIGRQLGLSPLATEEISTRIFDKLGLEPSPYLSRRVLAVLTLRQAPAGATGARSRDAAH